MKDNSAGKKVLIVLLCMVMTVAYMPQIAFAEPQESQLPQHGDEGDGKLVPFDPGDITDDPVQVYVDSWEALDDAVHNKKNDGAIIILSGDIDADGENYSIKVDGDNVKTITIDLAGHTMDRKRKSDTGDGHAINVKDGAALTITDSSEAKTGLITGGNATDGGGIKIEKDSRCIIEGGTISGNEADKDGGGIYAWGSLFMTGGTVSGNYADDDGGGIYVESSGYLDISGATIDGNTANGDGGAMNVCAEGFIKDCVISKNKSKDGDGGGVRFDAEDRTLMIDDTKITENTGDDNGGGIHIEDGQVIVTGGAVSGNKAGDGGGIYNPEGEIQLESVIISGNESTEYGGAGVNSKSTAYIRNCGISGNTAAAAGAGLYIEGKLDMSGGSVTDNASKTTGGAFELQDCTANVSGVTMTGNIAMQYGGAMYIDDGGDLHLSDCDIKGNTAYKGGGGIWYDKGSVSVGGAVTVTGNKASDVYISSGKKIKIEAPLSTGDKKSNIGVSLAGNTGVITSGYGAVQGGNDPSDHFTAEAGCSVIMDENEAKVIASEWGNLQHKINTAGKDDIISLDQDYKAIADDKTLTVPEGKDIIIDLNGHTIDRGLKSYKEFGEVITVDGKLRLEDSAGSGMVKGGYGGAGGVWVSKTGDLTFSGGSIKENHGNVNGGGVLNEGKLTIDGGKIENNSTENAGGAVYTTGSVILKSGMIANNTAKGNGGGIYIAQGVVTMSGSIVSSNSGVNGGGIYIDKDGTLELFGGSVTSNTASAEGGGVWHGAGALKAKDDPAVTDNKAEIGNNIMLRDGNVIEVIDKLTVSGGMQKSALLDVTADNIDAVLTRGITTSENIETAPKVFTYNGGSYDKHLEIRDNELYHIDFKTGVVWVNDWKELQNAIKADENQGKTIGLYKNITAENNDSSLELDHKNVTVELNGYVLDKNKSDDEGPVFHVSEGSSLTVRDSVGSGVITGGNPNNGGGIKIEKNATCVIEGGTIRGNKVKEDGGGIYVGGTLKMLGGAVNENSADDDGGGIYVDDTGHMELSGATIAYNSAENEGGGMNVCANGSIKDCIISNNRSEDTYGGGIRLDASDVTLTIDNTDITGNSADNDGGGIQINQGKLVMNGGSISDNTANDCGGIFNDDDGSMELTGVRITGNKSTGESGGGVNNQNHAVLTKCIIKNNSADDAGGGVYNKDDLTMTDCTLESNSADGKGGGLFNKSKATIENCTFTSNEASDDGGGLYTEDDASIINCTMTKNESGSHGGAVSVEDDELTVVNGVFTDNTAASGGSGFYINDNTSVKGAVVVADNKGDDVYLCSGDKLRIRGSLKDGENKAVFGVRLEKDTGTFTDGFKDSNPNEDPADIFNPQSGYSVIRDGDGEGLLVKSEWPRLQKLINDTAKEISEGEEAPVLMIDRDWKAADGDTMLSIPENKALIIDLNGHTINRNRSSEDKDGHVIMVSSGSMLTIRDSSSALSGLLTGGYGTNGGGINVQGGASLTVESGSISGNRAVNGGGINCRDNAKVSIIGGSITGNDATYGGGVYIADDEDSVVDITGGVITGNTAVVEGGGVLVNSKSILNVSGEPFIYGNSGAVGKNILLYQDAAVKVTGTLKTGSGMDGAKLDISAKTESGHGKETKLTDGLTSSGNADNAPKIFTYNESSYDSTMKLKDDGELYHKAVTADVWVSDWEELQEAVKKHIDGEVIGLSKDIVAEEYGNNWPIVISEDYANVVIELNGHKLDRNLGDNEFPEAQGTVIKIEAATSSLTIRDSAGTGIITGGYERNDDNGGGITIFKGTCIIEGGTITGNRSKNGGGIYVSEFNAKLIMTGGSIVNNTAYAKGGDGGGIYCRYDAPFEIKNVVISGNSASKGGGISSNSEHECKIESCRIIKNKADDAGGGIYRSKDGTLKIDDTEIRENRADSNGGGITVSSGKVVMNGGSVSGNKAGDGAGVNNSGGSIDFTGVKISGNTSTDHGGAGVNNKNNAKLTDCEITGNQAKESGGGVWTNEKMTITGGKISNNKTTDRQGGGICIWHAEAAITGTEISGNKASDTGGGIYINRDDDRYSDNETKVTLSNCTLTSNKAEESGGAIYAKEAKVRADGCTITGNETIECGGGIYISYADLDLTTELTLTSCVITDNTANQKGGGIYYAADTDELNISGPIQIHDNSGGDVYLEKRKEINVTGALTDGKTKASIGVVSEDDLGEKFTDDYRKHNDQDPAEFFFSNEGYEVYLTDGEAALRKPDVVIDTEKHFIAKRDQVDKNWDKLSASDWMSGLSGERYLHEINIPGTHDSGTKDMVGNVNTGQLSLIVGGVVAGIAVFSGIGIFWAGLAGASIADQLSDYMAKFAMTQRRYVDEQLVDGIRELDMRVCNYYAEHGWPPSKHDNGKDLWILHGKEKMPGTFFAKNKDNDFLNFSEILGICKDFLEKHPTETIIIDVDIQGIDVDEDECMDRLKKHIRPLSEELNTSTGEPFLYMEDGKYDKVFTHYPQLKECRGKIVLMGVTVGNGTGGLKKGVGLANVYGPEGDFHDNSEQKIEHLTNFYTVYGHDPLPRDGNNGKPALNYYYSTGTNCTDDRQVPQVTPLEYAADVLPVLFDDGGLLTDRQSLYLGLVNMDDANVKNNKQVWITNFGALDYCTVTVKSKKDDPEPKTYTVLRNTPIPIPECIYNDPNEKGQFFQYWKETKGSGSEEGEFVGTYYPDDTCTIKEDVTFTAVWDPDSTSCIRAAWEDGNNADKIRPDELEVDVTGTGSDGKGKSERIVVKSSENWRKNLDYTVTNVAPATPEGYTYTTKGTKITLRHRPEKSMSVSGDIQWRDDDNKEGKRPDSVTINLFEDGERTKEHRVTAADGWKYDFGTFPLYNENIKRIGYYLEENDIENYSKYVSGHTEDQGFIIINSLEKQFRAIEGLMLWSDENNKDGKRPEKVTIHLSANGTEVASQDVTVNNDGQWLFNFPLNQKIPYSGYSITVYPIDGYLSNVYMGDSAGDVPIILNVRYEHVHQPAEVSKVVKEATCEEKGSTVVYEFCTTCLSQLSVKDEPIAALGHDWGEWEVTKEATETETGLKTRVCKRDSSHIETQVIPIGGHQHVLTEIPEKTATCTEDGNIKYWKCTGGDDPCGMLFSDAEGAHEIAASDTVIKALGHKWGEWVETKPATETEEGEETRTCQNNNSHTEIRKVPKKLHEHEPKKVNAKAATCTEDGNIAYYYCTGCGWYFKDGAHPGTTWFEKGNEVIPALGHDWGEWVTVREATETEAGLEKRVCSHNDSHKETREIPVKLHEHVPKKVEAKAATCTEPGNIAYYTCEGCGWNFKDGAHPGTTWIKPGEEVIPALGHDYGEWEVTKPATDTEEGLETRTCSHNASHKETRVIPKTEEGETHVHDPKKKEAKAATCTEDGNIAYYCCDGCGWFFLDGAHPGTTWIKHDEVIIPALGHDWKAATCTKPKTCARCKATEGEPTGHKWSDPVYIWSDDNKTATAARICRNNPGHIETETVDTASEEVKPATCAENGETKYTAVFTMKHDGDFMFTKQEKTVADIDASGHKWEKADCTTAKTCTICHTTEGEPLGHAWKDATCTRAKTCRRCETTEGEPLGHSWKAATCTTPKTCRRCQATEGNPLGHSWKQATCTEPKTCRRCQAASGKPLGHAWEEPVYEWLADNSEVTAKRVCGNDPEHVETETVETTSEVIRKATCTEKGEKKYTAVFTEKHDKDFVFETQEKDGVDIDPLGHAWGEPTYDWSADNSEVTAKRVCRNDPEHVEKEKVNTTSEVTKEATCTKKGETAYTVVFTEKHDKGYVFEKQTKTAADVDPLGHDWKAATCTEPKTCNRCQITEGEPLGHSWGAWTPIDEKWHKRICTNDSTHVLVVEHGFDDGTVTKEATGTSTGIMTYTCVDCGYTRDEEIPKKGSDPNQKGTDGTDVGPGASFASAEQAILSMKNDKDPAGTIFSRIRLKSTRQKKKSIRLRWNRPKNAELYVIYGNRCGKKYRMKKIAALTGSSMNIRKIDGKKLKKGTMYKFIIIALDKDYNVVSTSKLAHVATRGGKICNYKAVKLNRKNKILTVKKGKHVWIRGTGVRQSRKLKVRVHRGIQYESSSKSIAFVTKAGIIKARKKGTCNIYAYAQNGVYRRIKVVVTE